MENKIEVYVSYAWSTENDEIISKIKSACDSRSIILKYDKEGIPYGKSISEFMENLSKGKFIILMISDKYLMSKNCMKELLNILKNGDFNKRTFPIILMSAYDIFDPIKALKYRKYWEDIENTTTAELKELGDFSYLSDVPKDIDLVADIKAKITELSSLLRDRNVLTLEDHLNENFNEILQIIENDFTSRNEINLSTAPSNLKNISSKPGNGISNESFDIELKDLTENELYSIITGKGYWELIIRPLESISEETNEVNKTWVINSSVENPRTGWNFPMHRMNDNDSYKYSRRYIEANINSNSFVKEFWRIYKSGQFINVQALYEDWLSDEYIIGNNHYVKGTVVNVHRSIVWYVTECFYFISKFLKEGKLGENVSISLTLHNVKDRRLRIDEPNRREFDNPKITNDQKINFLNTYSASDLKENYLSISRKIIHEVYSAFGFNTSMAQIETDQKKVRSY